MPEVRVINRIREIFGENGLVRNRMSNFVINMILVDL